MLKLLKPSKNRITQGYSSKHKGYDFSGRGDLNAYSSIYGKVVLSKNSETKHWINKGKLTTKDYGNYCKIKGEVDGKEVTQFLAHLATNTVVKRGEKVEAGQVVGQIGHTGNSTARHLHSEYRDEKGKNFPVSFVSEIVKEVKVNAKEQIIKDAYFAITGEYPSPDALKARLQKNENTTELIIDLLKGDAKSKLRWMKVWELVDRKEVPQEGFKDVVDDIKLILNPLGGRGGMDSAEVKAMISNAVTELIELRAKQIPATIYKHEGKEYEATGIFPKKWNIKLIIEK